MEGDSPGIAGRADSGLHHESVRSLPNHCPGTPEPAICVTVAAGVGFGGGHLPEAKAI